MIRTVDIRMTIDAASGSDVPGMIDAANRSVAEDTFRSSNFANVMNTSLRNEHRGHGVTCRTSSLKLRQSAMLNPCPGGAASGVVAGI